jgi:hypothetical protein
MMLTVHYLPRAVKQRSPRWQVYDARAEGKSDMGHSLLSPLLITKVYVSPWTGSEVFRTRAAIATLRPGMT